MPTIRQKKAAKVVVNGGSPTQAMREAEYAPSVIRKPKVLTDSRGFKEAIRDLGLTEELITGALVSDIEAKPKNRVPELRLGAEILGMNERGGEGGNKTLVIVISGESAQRYATHSSTEDNRIRPD